jgi:sulfopyruvate decarboxylase alpha subunit
MRGNAMVKSATGTVADWGEALYDSLRQAAVTQFAFVPDTGLKDLISRCLEDTSVRAISLTTEEEGVALLAGSDLGSARGVLLMQSSGVGNCINTLSLTKGGRFPLLMIVSMRGDFGEANPWQYPMGQAVQPVLEAMGVICLRADSPQDVEPITTAALSMSFQAGYAVAILLGQRLLGAKPYEVDDR